MKQNETQDYEKIIRFADANCSLEGIHATEKTKGDCLHMLQGKISADKLISQYVLQFAQG